MDKQTFYRELSSRLMTLGIPDDFISRHITQFEAHFKGKSDEEIQAEISKLGDLDKVAARIKKMTDKVINEAHSEQETAKSEATSAVTESDELPKKKAPAKAVKEKEVIEPITHEDTDNDEYVRIASKDEYVQVNNEDATPERVNTISNAPIDPEEIARNRKKFWTWFAIVLPLIVIAIGLTAYAFVFAFVMLAMVILISIGLLVFTTAGGTVMSVLGLIFGVSQMLSSVPVGLYECGVAICIGGVALLLGILIYNFIIRVIPYVVKQLLVFIKYVIKKYKELYIYIKKECIGI